MTTDDLVLVASIVGMQLLGLWTYDTFRVVRASTSERRLRQTRGYA